MWFTSDLHFFHKNIIKHMTRPFSDAADMNNNLIKNWNSCVSAYDDIYILGDVSFGDLSQTCELLEQLNGNKFLIEGNHDTHLASQPKFKSFFKWIKGLAEIEILDQDAPRGKQTITLCHYAMKTWNKSHYGSWQLYGHSHGKMPDDPAALQIDVGVDCHNFCPIDYNEIKAIMKTKTWTPPLRNNNDQYSR